MKIKPNKPPLKSGETIKLDIERLNHDGEGVGRLSGFTVFVPATAPGDSVMARVISVQKTYARALLETVINASPARVTPSCAHYDSCGGCQLQHLDYAEQLRVKREIVQESLRRIGGLNINVQPVIGMIDPWRYRNKAQVPVGMDGGTVIAGFFAKRSHRIVDVECCLLQHPANDKVVDIIRGLLRETGISAYNEKEHSGLLRHVLARTSFNSGETLVVLVTNGRRIPNKDMLVAALSAKIENLTGIVQNINTRRGNVILGNEEVTLWGKPYLTECLDGLTFRVSPRSFYQVNTVQTEVLYKKIREYSSLSGSETVIDLYCGIGTISLYLSRYTASVIGVESVPAAIEDAKTNAILNGLENVKFHTGLAEKLVPEMQKSGLHADVVVVDPPRKGCEQSLLDAIVAMQPNRLIYVSCNPSTLARDLKYLTIKGLIVQDVQPVDMFPHTSHVECVVLIKRK